MQDFVATVNFSYLEFILTAKSARVNSNYWLCNPRLGDVFCLWDIILKKGPIFEVHSSQETKSKTSQIFYMLEKRSRYMMGIKKISKKNSGRPPIWAEVDTKWTSMKFLTNGHFPLFICWLNLSSTAITKIKMRKKPKLENGTAISWLTRDNSPKDSF